MKISQIVGMVSGVSLMGVGAIAYLTNPPPIQYETYAGTQIAKYLKENICQNPGSNLPIDLGSFQGDILQNYCKTLVDASQFQLGELIGSKTSYENYFFFTIYQTDIVLPEPFPRYSFESIGMFRQFYTFRAEKS